MKSAMESELELVGNDQRLPRTTIPGMEESTVQDWVAVHTSHESEASYTSFLIQECRPRMDENARFEKQNTALK
jgi:hypothetical protein